MGDDDDAKAVGLQLAQNAEKHFDFTRVETGGRLIEHQHLAGKIDGAGNGDDLADGDGIGRQRRTDINSEAVAGKELRRIPFHPPAIDQPEAPGLASKEQVFRNRQVFEQVDLLIDGANAERLGFRHGCGRNRLAFKQDRSIEAVIGPGQDLDERGFAPAVFAEQGVDFTAVKREIDMVERGYAQKGFGDRTGFKKRCSHRRCSVFCSHGILPFALRKGVSGPTAARMKRISSRGPSWLRRRPSDRQPVCKASIPSGSISAERCPCP